MFNTLKREITIPPAVHHLLDHTIRNPQGLRIQEAITTHLQITEVRHLKGPTALEEDQELQDLPEEDHQEVGEISNKPLATSLTTNLQSPCVTFIYLFQDY